MTSGSSNGARFIDMAPLRHKGAALGLLVSALLAGCAMAGGASQAIQVASSDRMDGAEDWSRDLPDIYPGLMTCLAANPKQPAYAADVALKEDDMIEVYTVGQADSVFDCSVARGGATPTRNEPYDGTDFKGPRFYPEGHVGPVAACTSQDMEPVFSTDGRFLGWLSWPKC